MGHQHPPPHGLNPQRIHSCLQPQHVINFLFVFASLSLQPRDVTRLHRSTSKETAGERNEREIMQAISLLTTAEPAKHARSRHKYNIAHSSFSSSGSSGGSGGSGGGGGGGGIRWQSRALVNQAAAATATSHDLNQPQESSITRQQVIVNQQLMSAIGWFTRPLACVCDARQY